MPASINRFRVFILPFLLIQFILIGFVTNAGAQLPPEILADKHLIHAEQLHAAKDYAGAFEVMRKIVALQKEHNLTVPDDFHFKYARVALAADSMRIALESVSNYLSAAGKEGEFYQEALKVMLRAEGNEVKPEVDIYNDIIKPQGTCDGLPEGAECWMALTNHPECYVWNEKLREGDSAIWEGKCIGHVPDGKGTLTFTWYGLDVASGRRLKYEVAKSTGHFKNGKKEGKWNATYTRYKKDGSINRVDLNEENYVNGRKHGFVTNDFRDGLASKYSVDFTHYPLYLDGNYIFSVSDEVYPFREVEGPDENGEGQVVLRARDGSVRGGPYVNGKLHGYWIDVDSSYDMYHYFEGWEGRYVQGKRQGQWVYRNPDGHVREVSFVDGKKHGKSVVRDTSGTVLSEGAYVNDKKHGRWVTRDLTGTVVSEGVYVNEEKHGKWSESIVVELAYSSLHGYFDKGFVGKGTYVEGRRQGTWVYRHPNGDILRVEYTRYGSARDPWLWYDYDDEKCWALTDWYTKDDKKKKKVNKKKCLN